MRLNKIVATALVTAVLGLQAWALNELFHLSNRLTVVETKLDILAGNKTTVANTP